MTLNSTQTFKRRPDRRGNWLWSRLHFVVRLLGLLGFLAACVGLLLLRGDYPSLLDGARGTIPHDPLLATGVVAVLSGAAGLALALLVELVVLFGFVAARRSLFGFNAVVQIALAALLLIGVNVFAFWHPVRIDCTRAQQFTLPPKVEASLKKLKSDTTIVLYLPNTGKGDSGAQAAKERRYESEAERKIVEMVKDQVDQFREIGPQFHVFTLDVSRDENYENKLEEATKKAPKLRAAIEAAPENTIFFYQNGNIQRLSFNEFILLDKAASMEGGGNLVLLPQGKGESGRAVETFANRIFNVDQRRPRIGILVVHEILSTDGEDDSYTLKGLRGVLEARGFEVRDVLLKKGWRTRNIQPAADTKDEGKLETVDADIRVLEAQIENDKDQLAQLKMIVEDLRLKPNEDEATKLDKLSVKYKIITPDGRRVRMTSELRVKKLKESEEDEATLTGELEDLKTDLEEARQDRKKLDLESIAENKRMTDLDAKLQRVLADCDLLLIPRLTRVGDDPIPNRVHSFSPQQLAAVKAFLASGKPVLACLGPTSMPTDAEPEPPDSFEALLAELGIRLNNQTIMFNTDARAFAKGRSALTSSTGSSKIPPLDFNSETALIRGRWQPAERVQTEQPNPLRESLRVTARSAGHDFDLRVRFPRPVYFDPTNPLTPPLQAAGVAGLLASPDGIGSLAAVSMPDRRLREDIVFLTTGHDESNQAWAPAAQVASTIGLLTVASTQGPLPSLVSLPRSRVEAMFLMTGTGWNEEHPFPVEEGPQPRYRSPKPDDPATGTLNEKRRGGFPIGVALETAVPTSWTNGAPVRVRVAVIGQGDLFNGSKLKDKPANERLLLETVNWLLGRDDYLPTASHAVRYPRVELTETEKYLYQCGFGFGLPALFAFLGVVVLLMRRLR